MFYEFPSCTFVSFVVKSAVVKSGQLSPERQHRVFQPRMNFKN